jgi:hypothetical protein
MAARWQSLPNILADPSPPSHRVVKLAMPHSAHHMRGAHRVWVLDCSPHVSVRASASATGAFESSPTEIAHSPARITMVTSESPFSPRPLHTHPACATACAAIGTLADVRDRWDWRPEGTNKRLRADVHQRSENALHARCVPVWMSGVMSGPRSLGRTLVRMGPRPARLRALR